MAARQLQRLRAQQAAPEAPEAPEPGRASPDGGSPGPGPAPFNPFDLLSEEEVRRRSSALHAPGEARSVLSISLTEGGVPPQGGAQLDSEGDAAASPPAAAAPARPPPAATKRRKKKKKDAKQPVGEQPAPKEDDIDTLLKDLNITEVGLDDARMLLLDLAGAHRQNCSLRSAAGLHCSKRVQLLPRQTAPTHRCRMASRCWMRSWRWMPAACVLTRNYVGSLGQRLLMRLMWTLLQACSISFSSQVLC